MRVVRQVQHVVEEAVLFIPEPDVLAADLVHRVGDVDEVLPELAGDIFIGRIFLGQLQRNRQQVERVHGHPAGAIRLLDGAAGRQRLAAIKHADVVETEKAALENVVALRRLCDSPTR